MCIRIFLNEFTKLSYPNIKFYCIQFQLRCTELAIDCWFTLHRYTISRSMVISYDHMSASDKYSIDVKVSSELIYENAGYNQTYNTASNLQ